MNDDGSRPEAVARVVWLLGDVETTCVLTPRSPAFIIGRSSRADVRIDDERASRRHAEIFWEGHRWWLRDAGSRNGIYLGTSRLTRPARLAHGDSIRCGITAIGFLWPASIRRAPASSQPETVAAPATPILSSVDIELLAVLCGPYAEGGDPRSDPLISPPTNAAIAAQLHLSEAAVRQRLKRLYPKFGLAGAESTKRAELVARAIESGAVCLAQS